MHAVGVRLALATRSRVGAACEATYVIGWGAATKDLKCMSVIDGAAGEELLPVSIDDPQNFTYRCMYCE